jgi:regulator of replication initiation timing
MDRIVVKTVVMRDNVGRPQTVTEQHLTVDELVADWTRLRAENAELRDRLATAEETSRVADSLFDILKRGPTLIDLGRQLVTPVSVNYIEHD